jgi:hypothetical protein
MALVVANRVQETTTTTGTGTVTLAGAVAGYQSFAAIGDGNTTYYTLTSGNNWEVGIGTYTASGTTLARTTVLASSAGGTTKITLSGTSNVFVTYPSDKALYTDASGNAIALGTPASGTVTNLTGTASININGTVGATTASTGAFTTTTATTSVSSGVASTTQGSLVLHNTSANSTTLKSSNSASAAYTITLPVAAGTNGQVLTTDGTGVTSWATASGTPITSTSANAFAVGRQGNTDPVLNVDASTASVVTGLNLKGAAAAGGMALSVTSSGANENLTLDAKGSGTITLNGTATGGVTLSNSVTGTGSMALSASPTLTGTVTGASCTWSGDVYIGGTSDQGYGPGAQKLQVNSSAVLYGALATPRTFWFGEAGVNTGARTIGSIGYATGVASGSVLDFIVTSGADTAAAAKFNYNVGIGMTPTNILDITQNQNGGSNVSVLNNSATANAYAGYKATDGTTSSYMVHWGASSTGTGINLLDSMSIQTDCTNGMRLGTTASTPLIFYTNATERALFDSSGNFQLSNALIYGGVTLSNSVTGTGSMVLSASPSLSGILTVNGTTARSEFSVTAANTEAARFRSTSGSNAYGLSVAFDTVPNDTTRYFISCNSTAGTTYAIIYSNGNLANVNNSYGSTSDAKLKQDIVLAGSQWGDIKEIGKIVSKYRFKNNPNGPLQIGLVAQDVQAISPGLVNSSSDVDEETKQPLGTETLSVQYSVLYMKAVKALGEALERIETLEARLAALEAK